MTPEQESVLQGIRQRRKAGIRGDTSKRGEYKTQQDVLREIKARRRQRVDQAGPVETLGIAAENLIPSAKQAGSDIAHVLTNPGDVWESVKSIAGDIGKVNPVFRGDAVNAETPTLDALGKFYKDRYGSLENVKRTFAQDPVGFFSDLALPLMGGSGAMAKAPGIVGKAGKVAGKAVSAIDPINVGIQGTKAAGKLTGKAGGYFGKQGFGLATGTRPEVIGHAYKAGKSKSPAFRQAMRGEDSIEDILHDVEANVGQLQKQKSVNYEKGIASTKASRQKLSFDAIDDKLKELNESLSYKGKPMFDDKELSEVQRIKDLIDDWKSSPEVHDAGGMDALKRRIDQVNISPKDHPNAYRIKTALRNEIKKTIVDQVPEYAKVMKEYEDATKVINEIRKGLALNPNASLDLQLGKLSRLMTRNATDGKTKVLGMADLPGTSIAERLAGYQMSTATPKGLTGIMGIPAAGYASLATGSPIPMLGLLGQSPRLVGEGTHALGQGVGLAQQLARQIPLSPRAAGHGFFQSGRLANELQNRR